ncbi:MAG: hypothetical protein Q8T11_16200 [Elusimicrobiota bacterium]|nr:hypothetical protein [Elusimicrobiota bacterium]
MNQNSSRASAPATRFSAGSRGSTWNSEEASAAAKGAVTKRPSRFSSRTCPRKKALSKRTV